MKLIDADVLIKQVEELETEALEYVTKDEPSLPPERWHIWNAKLNERTLFKYELVDAPTIDAIPISFLEELCDKAQNEEAASMIDEIIAQWRYRHKIKASSLYGEMKDNAER